MANSRVPDSNSTVRTSRVNSAVSHRRIAFEAGLKDHIFLQFLWILATGAPLLPEGLKNGFFRNFRAVSFDHIL